MMIVGRCLLRIIYIACLVSLTAQAIEEAKDEVDKVIEDEITEKLSDDLLQSIEKKFQVDLQKSVDSVLARIKLLLHNGTSYIQDKLVLLQDSLEGVKRASNSELVDNCILESHNTTAALAEKALHQMVICGYALIGHDPAQAVKSIIELKSMIKERLSPIYEQKKEVYGLLKVCGHEHNSLKKVIKCVISKSPVIKSSMMDVTGKLIEGVVELTKLMAHGAMHEACLIEVIKSVEDEAIDIVEQIKNCAVGNNTFIHTVNAYMAEDNATVLDIPSKKSKGEELTKDLRRMYGSKTGIIDDYLKDKLDNVKKEIESIDTNTISKDILKE